MAYIPIPEVSEDLSEEPSVKIEVLGEALDRKSDNDLILGVHADEPGGGLTIRTSKRLQNSMSDACRENLYFLYR